MKPEMANKSVALLRFLWDIAAIRRGRIPAYGKNDKVVWFADLPPNLPEVRSPLLSDKHPEGVDYWLEVHKKRMPVRPPVPAECRDWVRPEDLERVSQEPVLLPQITVLVDRECENASASAHGSPEFVERVPQCLKIEDYPQVQFIWKEYLENQWRPWAEQMRRWQAIQDVYEDVDFIRRRLEEAEEHYELVLGAGLLVWRDSSGTSIKRHILTAPAEVSLDAARGVLTVVPAASLTGFRIELDMLELRDQPRIKEELKQQRLEELGMEVWDRTKVGQLLREIANNTCSNAQVDENAWDPPNESDDVLRVVYAPALILRERRGTGYIDVINKLIERTKADSVLTKPWKHFVGEGEVWPDEVNPDRDPPGQTLEDARLYFPLPTNKEQREIANRLCSRPYVLVKGPPGTGKSHTIANLICHLLALGQRVLVTAQAPKALAVLRDLLPGDIRNLCVTAFGSTREDQRLLEDSVRAILSRKNQWEGSLWAHQKISELERNLRTLEDDAAAIERDLLTIREAETYSHTLNGGYAGTAAQIARQVERKLSEYDWFPELPNENSSCPLDQDKIAILADVHSWMNDEKLKELRLDIGSVVLPNPDEFRAALANVKTAEQSAESARRGIEERDRAALEKVSDEALRELGCFLENLDQQIARASRVLGQLIQDILCDLLVGRTDGSKKSLKELIQVRDSLRSLKSKIGSASVEIAPEAFAKPLMADVRRRLQHFQKGGWRGLGLLAPRVVRQTRYIEKYCRIDRQVPRSAHHLDILAAFLELQETVEAFRRNWRGAIGCENADVERVLAYVEDVAKELDGLLKVFTDHPSNLLACIPTNKRLDLVKSDERQEWIALIRAETAERAAAKARGRLEGWLDSLTQIIDSGNAHPLIREMAEAIRKRDAGKWKRAWDTRQRIAQDKEFLSRYENMLEQIADVHPQLATMLKESQGQPEWKSRCLALRQAWAWAAAREWIRNFADPERYRRLIDQRRVLQDKIQCRILELATIKAWQAFFDQLDNRTEQSLVAWQRAIARIGKGTGKHAWKHRMTARQYLMNCVPKIPAWIMPLHKLWETAAVAPGVFDTVIVDEASQAGIDALVLFYLAKRVIVVGDDKQNSPEAVGILEEDIGRLAHKHLREFRFRHEFRPDTSLYDHAERAFGNVIALREHFRCVPEIIRFSNDLCYTDAPLIPLRQPPPNRLPPLRHVFVEEGSCKGEGQRLVNEAEADAVVETILKCLENEAYERKTMGVIVLQGHAQAELIEKKIAGELDPKVRQERKLRCGVPATFQGDQRDVIFLSLVVAPDHSFRALTEIEAQRRFNVAMSRARDQVWLFHSVALVDLSTQDLRWRLLHFFFTDGKETSQRHYEERERLERLAKNLHRQRGNQPGPYESWFELDVALELWRRGYWVRPQVEVAGYRIDLVVEDIQSRLAVECDGDAWHGPDSYYADLARQRQLERAGWTFVRVRESEFYADRNAATQRIVEACQQLGIRPVTGEQ
jgi:very-short-patch-repair endonuclease